MRGSKTISGKYGRSFTLIELLVAIFIAGILTSAVVVNLNVISTKRVETTGRSITADLIWARQMAVTTREDYIVNFLINSSSGGLDGYDIYRNEMNNTSRIKSRFINSVNFVAVKNRTSISALTNMTPTRIRFKPQGVITDSNNVTMNTGGLQLTLGAKNVTIGLFGETGQVVYKDWIVPGQGCFIATAAYAGSRGPAPIPEEVVVLQKFRDRYLTPSPWGKACVALYYRASPALAA